MAEKMIKRLYDAQDYNEELRFGVYGEGINVLITMIPDVMEYGRWYEITDKENGSGISISFDIDSNVSYNEDEDIFTFTVGELTIEIGE